MTTYFVAASGDNSDGLTWAKAFTSLAGGLSAASTDGDVVVIDKADIPSGDAERASDTTYTLAANVSVISATNGGGTSYTPSAMGTSAWIGNSTANRFISISGSFGAYFYGVTLRLSGSGGDNMTLASTSGARIDYEDCYFWLANTSAGSNIVLNATRALTRARNCTFRFGNVSQRLVINNTAHLIGGSVSSDGSSPTTLFGSAGSVGVLSCTAVGFDISHVSGTIVPDVSASTAPFRVHLDRCKINASVTPLASQSSYHSNHILLTDCSSGDVHGLFGYHDAYGSAISDTGIYFTAGAAAQSWRIDSTARASNTTPFVTPPIALYNTGTSAITPYLEILRDGSSTAYQDDEIWADFSSKSTSGASLATWSSGRMSIGGTPANIAAGAGTGSWTGEGGTAWSGKIDSGSTITPAEAGDIAVTICVAEPSITVYVDPQIRT